MQPMKKCSGCIGILEACCSKVKKQTVRVRKPCNGWQRIYMVQFFNEYNQELTMIKRAASPNAKSVISHLDEYNFTLPIKHLDWTHNLVLIKQVKDIRARYWYMVQRPHDVLALTGQCKSNDRTFGLKRPHVWASTTVRFSCNGHYSF